VKATVGEITDSLTTPFITSAIVREGFRLQMPYVGRACRRCEYSPQPST
jgi:hypothetical protein